MILLEANNKIIEETLSDIILKDERRHLLVEFADFDGVKFVIICEDAAKSIITIGVSVPSYDEFKTGGAEDALNAAFPGLVATPPPTYDTAITFNANEISGDKAAFLKKLTSIKRIISGAPVLKALESSPSKDVTSINYRPGEPLFIVKQSGDQATVIFLIRFRDADDVIIAKVFLQEFGDSAQRVQNSPSVSYSKNAPGELKGMNVPEGDDIGFVSFVLFKRQLENSQRENTVTNLLLFRDYLHYHIKCSKAYMHSRMRSRVDALLKVLNRAKQEPENKEKKTTSGRTFVRK